MIPASRVIWYQSAVPNAEVGELTWKKIIKFPTAGLMLSMEQFIKQCSHTPSLVNDIVFDGTFASRFDYENLASVLTKLPFVRRIAFVNAQVMNLSIPTTTLMNLTDLAITSCRCHFIPMTLLSSCHRLHSLDLSNNCLQDLPVVNLLSLTRLNLSKNFLNDVPLLVTQAIALRHLDMSSNRLQELSIARLLPLKDSLISINISGNSDIRVLPPDLLLLQRLEKLDVTDLVSLKSPPYSLAKNGLEIIKKYIRSKQNPKWLKYGTTNNI